MQLTQDLCAEAGEQIHPDPVGDIDAHQPGDFEFRVFGEHALADTPGAQVIAQLRPEPANLITPKGSYSAFADSDLETTCRVHDITRVVIVGQHTDCCCGHTVYDAFRRGLEIAVVSGATAYHPADPHDVAGVEDILKQDAYLVLGSAPAEHTLRNAAERAHHAGAGRVETLAVQGWPVPVLDRAVAESGANLLVVGDVGLNTLAGRILGSLPHSLVHRTGTDVLIVHTS